MLKKSRRSNVIKFRPRGNCVLRTIKTIPIMTRTHKEMVFEKITNTKYPIVYHLMYNKKILDKLSTVGLLFVIVFSYLSLC